MLSIYKAELHAWIGNQSLDLLIAICWDIYQLLSTESSENIWLSYQNTDIQNLRWMAFISHAKKTKEHKVALPSIL